MQLQITSRDTTEKLSVLRERGILPAVFYGRKESATPIALNHKAFMKVLAVAGESSVVTLEGVGTAKEALIHAVALDPVSNEPIHADFYVIEKGKPVTVSVPLEFTGVSPAVKDLGAVLVKVMRELEIEVLPAELPHAIIVDISVLKEIGDHLSIKDLPLPKSAIPSIEGDELVAMVSAVDEEPVEQPPMDISQIEVQERGKKEEESVITPEE